MIIKHSSIKQASTLEHGQIVSSNMNVEKLFATAAVSGSMDEKQLNQQISLMINAFMQQQGVAKKISLPGVSYILCKRCLIMPRHSFVKLNGKPV